MKCQRCSSERVASVTSKSSDCNGVVVGNRSYDGYMPEGMGIGGGDYVEFQWCLDCGQIQGKWPLPISDLEKPLEEES